MGLTERKIASDTSLLPVWEIWKVVGDDSLNVSLHDFQTVYDTADLYDFLEYQDIQEALTPSPPSS